MSDNELLLAISNIVRKNTEYLEARLCGTEDRLDNKIDSVEQRLSNRIDNLDIKINDAESRLGHEIRKINLKLENDIEIIQDVVKEHGKAIQELSA